MAKDLSTTEAMERLGVTRTRILQMIHEGPLQGKAEKKGRDWFIPEAEIVKLEAIDRKPGRPVGSTKKETGKV